jgi:hypothetical protein
LPEQNGAYETGFYVAKKGLVSFKSDRSGMSLTLAGTDAVPLVNKGWDVSFARIETNKKAIAEKRLGVAQSKSTLAP